MKKVFITTSVVGTIIVIIFFIFIGIKKISTRFDKSLTNLIRSKSENLPNSQSLPEEYLTLLKPKYRSKMLVDIVRESKLRNPIADLEVDRKYFLFIYKINLEKEVSLNDNLIMTRSPKEASELVGLVYTSTNTGLWEFINKSGPVPNVSKIYLDFNADFIIKGIANDSLMTYKCFTNNLSICYKKSDTADIIIKGKDQDFGGSFIFPVELLFLKRKSSLFFLTLSVKNASDTIPNNFLYNIVTNQ